MGFLETFLKESKTSFVAGTESLSIADLAILATYTSIAASEKAVVDLDEWPKTKEWAERVKERIPNYEKANGKGVKDLHDMIKEATSLLN